MMRMMFSEIIFHLDKMYKAYSERFKNSVRVQHDYYNREHDISQIRISDMRCKLMDDYLCGLFFSFLQYWDLNSGLHLEPLCQPVL
jgi:hypothetical protein